MNLDDLLNDKKAVPFAVDGGRKKGKLDMQSPTAEAAREVRNAFYKLGRQIRRDDDTPETDAPIAAGFESCYALAVKACIAPSSPLANMSDAESCFFVKRIGGEESEVVKYALVVCGVYSDGDEASQTEGDHTDFS